MFRKTLVIGSILLCIRSLGQYGAGAAGGTWEGIWGVASQPASILICPHKAEINIVRLGADVDNSYFYLSRSEFGLFGYGRRVKVDTTEAVVKDLGSSDRAVLVDVRVMLPSFSLRLGERSAFAFTNQARVAFTALDLDQLARKFGIDTVHLDPGETRRLNEVAVRAAAVSWMEHGLTFGHSLHIGDRARLHGAVTGKYAIGIVGVQIENRPARMTGLNDSVEVVTEVNADYALVLPSDPPFANGIGGLMNGKGLNADGGLVFEWLRTGTTRSSSAYLLRVGVSLTDIGSIRFDRNARANSIRNGTATVSEIENLSVNNVNELDTSLSQLFLRDPSRSYRASNFSMGLPMAIHGSVDYSPVRDVGIRLEATIGLRKPPYAVQVRDVFSITPRFERRNIGVAVPMSIDRYGNLAVGGCLRVAGFMIGSDRIGGLFGLNNVSGADLYFGAKVGIRGNRKKNGLPRPDQPLSSP